MRCGIMRNSGLFTYTVLLVSLVHQCRCWFGWPFGQQETAEEAKEGSDAGLMVKVPFEISVADEKFLAEGKEYGLQKSDLDLCHHKAILQMHTSCHQMTEEDIGKLSVNLLNCQSAVERRPTYPCTDRMTLHECTKNMDATTWNAYHIVSNRARAVCYSIRQQQFTIKTEMTVDKLMSSTENQLLTMEKIKVGQEKVGQLAEQTMQNVAIGQSNLMQQQEKLKSSQSYIHNLVVANLRDIVREKALIAAGQKELAHMTEKIRKKLDEASSHLQKNDLERLDNHREVMKDLSVLQNKSKDVWGKIDQSTQRILKKHTETVHKYQETLENLQRINETVNHLMLLVEHMRTEVNTNFGWLGQLLGGTGDQLTVLNSCIFHTLYFLLAAIIAAFIQAPYLSRLVLLILVPLNAFSEIKQGTRWEFSSLTIIIAFSALAQWAFSAINMFLKKERLSWQLPAIKLPLFSSGSASVDRSSEASYSNGPTNHQNTVGEEESDESSTDLNSNSRNGPSHDSDFLHPTSKRFSPYSETSKFIINRLQQNGVKRDLFPELDDSLSTRSSRGSTPLRSFSRSSTPSKRLCTSYNKLGKPCKGICISGKDFCHHHSKDE